MDENVYDVVIAGGGPAGLGAAVALTRSRRTVLVVDSGDPRHAPAAQVHNYPGREGTPPGDLLAAGRAELAGYGGEMVTGTVTAAEHLDDDRRDGARFRVMLADGQPVVTGGVPTRTCWPGACWSPRGWPTSCLTCRGWRSGGAAMYCTARTATAGRCATR